MPPTHIQYTTSSHIGSIYYTIITHSSLQLYTYHACTVLLIVVLLHASYTHPIYYIKPHRLNILHYHHTFITPTVHIPCMYSTTDCCTTTCLLHTSNILHQATLAQYTTLS